MSRKKWLSETNKCQLTLIGNRPFFSIFNFATDVYSGLHIMPICFICFPFLKLNILLVATKKEWLL